MPDCDNLLFIIESERNFELLNMRMLMSEFIQAFKSLLAKDFYSKIPGDDVAELQKYKLYRTFSLIAILVVLLSAVEVFTTVSNKAYLGVILIISATLFVVNYILLQKHHNVKAAYAFLLLNSFAVLHLVTYDSGGIRNSGMFYLAVIMLSAYMLLGNKWGRVTLFICLADIIYFFIISEYTNWVSNVFVGNTTTLIDQDFLITCLLSIFFLSGLSSNLLSSKNIVIQRITESRNELRIKNIELKKLSLVASKTNNAVIIANNKGILEWVNDGFSRMTGFSFEEVVGKSDKCENSILGTELQKIAEGQNFSGELQKNHKDGHVLWLQVNMTPILDADNNIEKYIFIESDITEKKLVEEAKAQSDKLYRIISENSKDIICLHDNDGTIKYVSPSIYENLGYMPDELAQLTFMDILHPHDLMGKWDKIQQTMREQKDIMVQLRLKSKADKYIYFETIFKPVTDELGNIIGYQSSSRDIQMRKEAEIKMELYMRDLEKINKELDKFAYIVSHDLKAPLRAIANLSSWIEEDMGSHMGEEVKSNFDLLLGRVVRMEALIDGILAYSRISRQKNPRETVDVKQLVNQSIDLLGRPAGFEFNFTSDMPVIFTDKIKLQQVFMNLIGNAIKHNDKPDGKINISCEEMNDSWRFSVEDNGPGIENEFHDRIFIIFQTLLARDKKESTGVGLAIVKKIMDEQNGKVWVDSEKGKGSVFNFIWMKKYQNEEEKVSASIAA